MIELFTADTPNGIKIPIALEELGVKDTGTVATIPSSSGDTIHNCCLAHP